MRQKPIYYQPEDIIEFKVDIYDGDLFNDVIHRMMLEIKYKFLDTQVDEIKEASIAAEEQIQKGTFTFEKVTKYDYDDKITGEDIFLCIKIPQVSAAIKIAKEKYKKALADYNDWLEKNKDKIEAYNKKEKEKEDKNKLKLELEKKKEKERAIKNAIKLLKQEGIDKI